jgi:cytidine deaminase
VNERADQLIEAAKAVREHAYAPYSTFPVGAAVLAGDEVFAAPNVENASYPLSVCAERNAVAAAVAAGHRRIDAVAVVGGADTPTPPCGGCLQVLYEFGGHELQVFSEALNGERARWALGVLLPIPFSLEP